MSGTRLRRLVVGVLAGIGALAIAWGLYALAVPEPADMLPERLSDRSVTDPGATLAGQIGAPLLEGNAIELLVNGDEIFPAMLEAIRGATTSISFLTYIYWQGDIAIRFADELAAACRRGVETRILLDAYGAKRMDEGLVRRMQAAGCRVDRFRPLHWYTIRRFNHRTHRRVLVVDGRTGFTGGVGIASEWTGDARDPSHWRDDHFRLEGPVVRYLQGAFAENWREATGEVLAGPRVYPMLMPRNEVRMVPILGGPGGSVSQIAFLYWLFLAAARERVDIATPYFAPDPQLARAIAETAGRGIAVRLLVPNERNDAWVVRYASRTLYRDLLEAGVRIYEYQPTMMHAKAVTVDSTWAIVGTANFDNRSFELNYEIVVAAEDPAVVASLGRAFEADLARAREITLGDVEEWSMFARIRDRLALLVREQI